MNQQRLLAVFCGIQDWQSLGETLGDINRTEFLEVASPMIAPVLNITIADHAARIMICTSDELHSDCDRAKTNATIISPSINSIMTATLPGLFQSALSNDMRSPSVAQSILTMKDTAVRDGLYKVDFHTVHGSGCGVIYASNGQLRGGNSGFAFIGSYQKTEEKISAKVSTQRHNYDPNFRSLFGLEGVTLTLCGTPNGDMVDFEGNALQAPGVNFRAVLTHLSD